MQLCGQTTITFLLSREMHGWLGEGGFQAASDGEAYALQHPGFIPAWPRESPARTGSSGQPDIGTSLLDSPLVPPPSMESGTTLGAQQMLFE